jgi:hypothetical protein
VRRLDAAFEVQTGSHPRPAGSLDRIADIVSADSFDSDSFDRPKRALPAGGQDVRDPRSAIRSLRKFHAVHELSEARIGMQGLHDRIGLQRNNPTRPILIGLVELLDGPVLVASIPSSVTLFISR